MEDCRPASEYFEDEWAEQEALIGFVDFMPTHYFIGYGGFMNILFLALVLITGCATTKHQHKEYLKGDDGASIINKLLDQQGSTNRKLNDLKNDMKRREDACPCK